MLARMFRRLAHWWHRDRREAELHEEMAFHRAMLARQRDGDGGGRSFGNITLAREDARNVWTWRWLEQAGQDARWTARSMRRQPVFAAAAMAIVALGIGAASCVVGVLDALVGRSLPVERPGRLVRFGRPGFAY